MRPAQHLLLPGLCIDNLYTGPYELFLADNLARILRSIDREEVASSSAFEGALIELCLYGEAKTDWLSVIETLLVQDDQAVAYSKAFASQLRGFDAQWKQCTISAAYEHFWIRKSCLYPQMDFSYLGYKKSIGGLYFDSDVSPTRLATRMKVEVAASTAFVLEMNRELNFLTGIDPGAIREQLDDVSVFPKAKYLSLEYFREVIFQLLELEDLHPTDVPLLLERLAEESRVGWSDFRMQDKTDDYMGTLKRISRDVNVHSPLIALYARDLMRSREPDNSFEERLEQYVQYLAEAPFDVPALKMRDFSFDFGPGLTTLEAIAAISLTDTKWTV